jgi:hypothetical protein
MALAGAQIAQVSMPQACRVFEGAATGPVFGVNGAANSAGNGSAGINGGEGATTGGCLRSTPRAEVSLLGVHRAVGDGYHL